MKRKKKSVDLTTFAFTVLIIFSLLFVLTNYLTSGLLAKYISKESEDDDGQVAKWEINFDDSSILNTYVSPTYLDYGSYGEWILDIENSSEVAAELSQTSEIVLKLYSSHFDPNHHHDTWDFLHDEEENFIDNPLNFRIYLYNCNSTVLNDYYLKDGIFSNAIQQEGLNVQEYKILDTQTSLLDFNLILEDGVLCHKASLNFGELNDIYMLACDGGTATLRVVWNVSDNPDSESVEEILNTYDMILINEFDANKHAGIVNKTTSSDIVIKGQNLTADQIQTLLNNNSFTIGSKKYVIAYEQKDAFEYLIYTSSLGGEVMITLEEDDSIYVKKSSLLSQNEKDALNSRTINSISTLTDLSRYLEKLNYGVFMDYLEDLEQYQNDKGYLGLGLRCSIELNLKVEQVD